MKTIGQNSALEMQQISGSVDFIVCLAFSNSCRGPLKPRLPVVFPALVDVDASNSVAAEADLAGAFSRSFRVGADGVIRVAAAVVRLAFVDVHATIVAHAVAEVA